jgi:hypothetical protein
MSETTEVHQQQQGNKKRNGSKNININRIDSNSKTSSEATTGRTPGKERWPVTEGTL